MDQHSRYGSVPSTVWYVYLIPVCTVRYGMYEEEGEVGGGVGEVLVESWKKPWQVNKWSNLLSIWIRPKDLTAGCASVLQCVSSTAGAIKRLQCYADQNVSLPRRERITLYCTLGRMHCKWEWGELCYDDATMDDDGGEMVKNCVWTLGSDCFARFDRVSHCPCQRDVQLVRPGATRRKEAPSANTWLVNVLKLSHL